MRHLLLLLKDVLPACLRRWAGLALLAWCGGALAQVGAAPAPYKLRVVGGLAGVSQYVNHEEPFWTRDLARLSQGRYSADIVPFDRAGVPGTEMLRLLQLGVVPLGTVLMSQLAQSHPHYALLDLPALNADLSHLRSHLSAYRPYLERSLREQHGVELLAVYIYPAQVFFCKQPLTRLQELVGRRVRVSSIGQADFVSALGATPVNTAFSQIAASLQAGETDCAITGALSGHTLGLYRVTQYLYPLPVSWGVALFAANREVWDGLPADLRQLLREHLPRLQAAIWTDAQAATTQGLACNSGAPSCQLAEQGHMRVVPVAAQDERRSEEIFRTVVLPRTLQRCKPCASVWQATLGTVVQPAPSLVPASAQP